MSQQLVDVATARTVLGELPQLFGYNLTAENEEAIADVAIAQGWVPYGRGNCANVFVHDTKALKIFFDSAYLDYLTNVAVMKKNPAFPVVHDGPFIGDCVSAVMLERLRPLTVMEREIGDRVFTVADLFETYGTIDQKESCVRRLKSEIGAHGLRAITSIVNFAKRRGYETDFRNSNIMIRSTTNQIVFTDPVRT